MMAIKLGKLLGRILGYAQELDEGRVIVARLLGRVRQIASLVRDGTDPNEMRDQVLPIVMEISNDLLALNKLLHNSK